MDQFQTARLDQFQSARNKGPDRFQFERMSLDAARAAVSRNEEANKSKTAMLTAGSEWGLMRRVVDRNAATEELQKARQQRSEDQQAFVFALGASIIGCLLAALLALRAPPLSRIASTPSDQATRAPRIAAAVLLAMLALATLWWLPLLGPNLLASYVPKRFSGAPWNPPLSPLTLQIVASAMLIVGAVRYSTTKSRRP